MHDPNGAATLASPLPVADPSAADPATPPAVVDLRAVERASARPGGTRSHGVRVPRPRAGRAGDPALGETSPPRPAPTGVDPRRLAEVWRHRPYLLAVARRRVAWHDAEDVVHEAVVRAIRDALVPEARLRSWLVTTTVRLCADRHRDEASQRRRRVLLGARPETTVQAGPEEQICDDDEAAWLAQQVELLPGRQAEAVRLRAEGLTLVEVGAEMGVPPKAVEGLLGRARRVLRAEAAAAVAIWAGTRLVVKRKTQFHVVALGLGVACSAGISGWEASQDVASYGAHQVSAALGPSWHHAERWARHHHLDPHAHRSGAHRVTTARAHSAAPLSRA